MNHQMYIAYHESAHAILALVNNCDVSSIKSTKKDGVTYFIANDQEKKYDHKKIQILLAGYEAECYLSNILNTKKPLKTGSKSDFDKIKRLISKNKKLKTNSIELITKKKIKLYWSDIALLTSKLLNDNEIESDEIKYILTQYSDKKKYWQQKFDLLNKKF